MLQQYTLEGDLVALKTKKKRRTVASIPSQTRRNRNLVLTVLQLGAGGQSSYLCELAIAGEIKVDMVIFADTGDEPDWVYGQVWYLAERCAAVGIPLMVVRRQGGSLMEQVMRGAFKGKGGRPFMPLPLYTVDPKTGKAGRLKKQCTTKFKIDPSDDLIKDWLIKNGHGFTFVNKRGTTVRRVKPSVQVNLLYGISLDELHRAGKRGPQWQKAIYPLIDKRMTRDNCYSELARRGLKIPRKSACVYCPYGDDERIYDFSINSPGYFERICFYDDWMRSPEAKTIYPSLSREVFFHRSCKPLRDVPLAAIVEEKRRIAEQQRHQPQTIKMFAGDLCGDHCMT